MYKRAYVASVYICRLLFMICTCFILMFMLCTLQLLVFLCCVWSGVKGVVVASVEAKTREHLDRQCLGSPLQVLAYLLFPPVHNTFISSAASSYFLN